MNRVSTSTRADNPGCAGTFRSVKIPPTCGFFSGARVPCGAGYPDEVCTRDAGVGPDVQHAAGAGAHRRAGRHRGNRVAERDDDGVLVGPDEQPMLAGLKAVDRQRREHQAAVGGQSGDRRAWDGNVQCSRRPGHQRCSDIGHVAIAGQALRPQDRRSGLFDRKQWNHARRAARRRSPRRRRPTARADASIAHFRRGARGTMVGDCVRPATMQPAWRAGVGVPPLAGESRTIGFKRFCDAKQSGPAAPDDGAGPCVEHADLVRPRCRTHLTRAFDSSAQTWFSGRAVVPLIDQETIHHRPLA